MSLPAPREHVSGWLPVTRPLDVWRICGEDLVFGPGCGCTCGPNDPTRLRAERAAERLGVHLPERPPRRRPREAADAR